MKYQLKTQKYITYINIYFIILNIICNIVMYTNNIIFHNTL